jgi:tetratricopeptide (TPR) repeat protein
VRSLLVVAALVLAALLGVVQLASTAAYGDLAARPSFPAWLHRANPALLRPFLGGSRARAAAAVHSGDLAEAERLLAGAPDDGETADLRGQIAQAKGDRAGAIQAYVRAGDVVRAQALIDALAPTDLLGALADQRRLVAALARYGRAEEVTGDAWLRLGVLQAQAGYADPVHRPAFWREAETSYRHALALAPNDHSYLLSAAYQALANGHTTDALRWYQRATEIVTNSRDGYAGLALASAARGDCAHAAQSYARWRTLRAPGDRDPVDDPLVGAPLKRCAP